MKRSAVLILVLFCGVCAAHPEQIQVEVIKVHDGDSIKVNIPNWPEVVGKNIGIRVAHIDTPELRARCIAEKARAIEAKAFVLVEIENADSVWLENVGRDKYFRLLADVYIDGKNLSEMLIENNLAVYYEGGTKRDWCYD